METQQDYNKAMESLSQALLTPDTGLQSKGHYNLGNTLYQRGETEKSDDKKLSDWTDALNQYDQTLNSIRRIRTPRTITITSKRRSKS